MEIVSQIGIRSLILPFGKSVFSFWIILMPQQSTNGAMMYGSFSTSKVVLDWLHSGVYREKFMIIFNCLTLW